MSTETQAPAPAGQAPSGLTVEGALAKLAEQRAREQAPDPAKPGSPDADPAAKARVGPETGEAEGSPDQAEEGREGGTEDERKADEEPTEDDAPAEGEDKVVLPDGTEMTVKELYEGHLRAKDYTQKTQALAEERRTLDTQRQTVESQAKEIDQLKGRVGQEQQQLAQELAYYRQAMGEIAQAIQQQGQQANPWAKVDWAALRQSDPQQFALEVASYQLWQQQHGQQQQAIQAQLAQAEQRAAQLRQAEDGQRQQALEDWTRRTHPEWLDPKQGQEFGDRMRRTAEAAGYSLDDIRQTLDPRGWELLWKASEYDRLKAGVASVTEKAAASQDGKLRVVRAQATAPRHLPSAAQSKYASTQAKLQSGKASVDDGVTAMQARRAMIAARSG